MRSGIVIIRHRLREGEELSSNSHPYPRSPSGSSPPPSSLQLQFEPIPMEFEVATIDDLLIKVGQPIKVGDLLGRRSSERLRRARFALQLARASMMRA